MMSSSPQETPIVGGIISAGTVKGTDTYAAVDITDPTQSPAGSTKIYTISQLYNFIANAEGLTTYAACICSTTANLVATYNNNISGVGATLTSTTPTIFIADGITPVVGQRVFVPAQNNNVQNGIYVLTQQGDGITVPYILTRAADFNQNNNIVPYGIVMVELGNTYAGKVFQETGQGPFTVGTTSIIFSPYVIPSATSISFYATTAGHVDVTGDGTQYIAIFESVLENFGAAYNTTNGIFTAPNTGWYQFNTCISINGITSSHTAAIFSFTTNTTLGTFRIAANNPYVMMYGNSPILSFTGSTNVYLLKNQNLAILYQVLNGTKVIGLDSSAWFSGRFLG